MDGCNLRRHDDASVTVPPGEIPENETQEDTSRETEADTTLYLAAMPDLENKLQSFGLSSSSVLSDAVGKVKYVYPRKNTKYEAKINVRVGVYSLNRYFGIFDDVQDAAACITLAWSFLHTPLTLTGAYGTTWDVLKKQHPFFPRKKCMKKLKDTVLRSWKMGVNLVAQFVAFTEGLCALTEAEWLQLQRTEMAQKRRHKPLNPNRPHTKRAPTKRTNHYHENIARIRDAAFAIASMSADALQETPIAMVSASNKTPPSHAPLTAQDYVVADGATSSASVYAPTAPLFNPAGGYTVEDVD